MEDFNKLTKKELIERLNNKPPKQDTVMKPASGFLDVNDNATRAKIILSEEMVNTLVNQLKDGYVGLTASFLKRGNTYLVSEEYINSFDDAREKHNVNLSSMYKQMDLMREYKSGNFVNLIKEENV